MQRYRYVTLVPPAGSTNLVEGMSAMEDTFEENHSDGFRLASVIPVVINGTTTSLLFIFEHP